jgi:hypothetical protein
MHTYMSAVRRAEAGSGGVLLAALGHMAQKSGCESDQIVIGLGTRAGGTRNGREKGTSQKDGDNDHDPHT